MYIGTLTNLSVMVFVSDINLIPECMNTSRIINNTLDHGKHFLKDLLIYKAKSNVTVRSCLVYGMFYLNQILVFEF